MLKTSLFIDSYEIFHLKWYLYYVVQNVKNAAAAAAAAPMLVLPFAWRNHILAIVIVVQSGAQNEVRGKGIRITCAFWNFELQYYY